MDNALNMMEREHHGLVSDELVGANEKESESVKKNEAFSILNPKTWKNATKKDVLLIGPKIALFIWDFFVDFYWAYIIYFVIIGLLGGLILWGIEGRRFAYIDMFFTATSCVCVTGLDVVDTHIINLGGQIWMLILILLGGEVFCSTYPLFANLFFAWRNRNEEFPDDAPEKVKEMRKYRLKCIAAILIASLMYWFWFQVIGIAVLMVYDVFNRNYRLIYYSKSVNPLFGTIFLCISAFNNAGFSPFSDSIVQFALKWLPLTVWAILILAGNTAYPVFLRCIFRILHWMFPWSTTFRMALKYARVYYTNMFPWSTTFIIVGILIVFNGLQAIITYIFDWDYNLAAQGQNWFYKLVDGMFQSISTRTCGLNTIGIGSARAPVLVTYLVMMYIANYPVAVAIKGSETMLVEQANKKYGTVTAKTALRNVALNDLFIVGLFFFIVSICEVNFLIEDSDQVNLFAILFEVVSAYGTVGLSIGFGADATSLVGRFNTVGKIAIIFVMILGRCRRISNKHDSALLAYAFWNESFWRDDQDSSAPA